MRDLTPPQVEAIPDLIMAVMILLFLPSFPFSSTFLNARERAIAQARLDRDHKPQSHGGMTGWQGFKAIVTDLNAWLLMMVYATCEFLSVPLLISHQVITFIIYLQSILVSRLCHTFYRR